MKKLILAAIFCMLATATFAQNNGLGFRVGSGAELQYERYFNSGNVLKLNAGLYDYSGNYFGTIIYDWDCFTWEFMNTVQRLPRFTGASAKRPSRAKSGEE